MRESPAWFDRTFEVPYSADLLPQLHTRLRGSPARLEETVRQGSRKKLITKVDATWSAQERILEDYRATRRRLMKRVEALDASLFPKAIPHPRLRTPMKLADHLYFVAEHDDHHLARIWALVNARR
ncbi:MAG: DinB family protein [bacterium]